MTARRERAGGETGGTGDADLIDAAGTRHAPAGDEARIVSLVPSITELLFDLGLGANLVGRTAFCVHPADQIEAVTSVGGTKKIDRERLRALRPSHVVVNVDETPRRLALDIAASGCALVVTHPIEVRDNLALYRLMGGLFGRREAAAELCARFDAAYAETAAAATGWRRRQVLYLIWKEPWMTVSRDTYVSRLLELVNWRTVADDPETRYPTLVEAAGLPAGTDLVLFASEPFPFQETDFDAFATAFPGTAPYLAVDGQMLSWYGSRAIAALAYLRRLAARQG